MTLTTRLQTGDQPTTNLGATTAEHKAMLDHLITIGTALNTNPREWARADSAPKDLTAIRGIGPVYEQELHFANIETVEQLANIDEPTKSRLDDVAGFPYAGLENWIEQAKELAKTDRADPEAAEYQRVVFESAGHPIDDKGGVTKIMKEDVEGKPAILATFDLYDAPQHAASQRLKAALEAFNNASDGNPRVPLLILSEVEELQRARDALDRGATIDDEMDRLNRVLGDARIQLRRQEPEPAAGAGQDAPGADAPRGPQSQGQYGNRGLAVASGYDNIDATSGPYGNAGLAEASGYDNIDATSGPYGNAGLAVASGYDNINPLAPEFALRSGAGGARTEGGGYRPPEQHEPGSADSVELARPGRGIDESVGEAAEEAQPEQEAAAVEEEG